jgi:subtilisin family serine protease
MARDLDHLPLPAISEPLPARRVGGGRRRVRPDRERHGHELTRQIGAVHEEFERQLVSSPAPINPKLIFKVQFDPDYGTVPEDALARMGLRVLAHEPEKAVVVFPDQHSLEALRRRVNEYAGVVPDGHQYGELDAVQQIFPLSSEDRIGSRLRERPLGANETTYLDVELWHTGDRADCRRLTQEVRAFLDGHDEGLRVTDTFIGDSLCLVRALVNASALSVLLETDYVKEVDRRPQPSFELSPVVRIGLEELDAAPVAPADDLIGVLVIDSGVAAGHPLIGPAIGDAQIFPDGLRQRVRGGPEDGDSETGGHGTAVAGIAVYNSVGECIEQRMFQPSARLFSARVTDDRNEYDETELLEHQLEEAVTYFVEAYPSVRVINISLGDRTKIYGDGLHQFRFAAAIDELAYRLRDRELVFVISSGNYWPDNLTEEEILTQYPRYLLDNGRARICDPATAALALTVGGLSYGAGRYDRDINEDRTDRLVAGERGWPSPFTRVGRGVDGSIKPDVVDFAGDLRFERGRIRDQTAQYAGLPTTSKSFAPPEGHLFRLVAGTSFAAPKVSNLAARLFREIPGASSNLVRALIASSARTPDNRPQFFAGKHADDPDVLRVYGYGQPDFERARWSSEQEVLLTADDTMDIDTFRLYEVPALPEEFLTAAGSGCLDVTLAFDPPTRHTRADSYLGVSMEAHLFRNLRPDQVADMLREWAREEKDALAEGERLPSRTRIREEYGVTGAIDLSPGVNTRKKGTLQRAWVRITNANWSYDREPLLLAVLCKRKWAPAEVSRQRFAVIVTLSHENEEIRLHSRIREQIRLRPRLRLGA